MHEKSYRSLHHKAGWFHNFQDKTAANPAPWKKTSLIFLFSCSSLVCRGVTTGASGKQCPGPESLGEGAEKTQQCRKYFNTAQWRSQPKNLREGKKFWGAKMFDFRRITLFCLEKRLSKHKVTVCSGNLGGAMVPLPPSWLCQ